ncbi:S-adenosyl-L-methionine-dependent methyltransferase [Lophiostoma macrostomum CBS 122681]|uniref:S-adenosyl-L-methionine-dependent methyltransferase n=1 Tax=Lophiostoma macrostomum CBS 122681 TaxID=1314788 RepID=A0A6A6TW01_9PLEO|nr:S-adenosyl-L-methionine-dependent methyltransferase [Lophiostoma macrostomum CBS 122681]
MASDSTSKKNDWSASQYLKFNNERTRAVYDLVSQIVPHVTVQNPRIYDLGCGPGNSTQVLLDAFPDSVITGMDSSPDMLQKARSTEALAQDNVDFELGDLSNYTPDARADLLFSNAVFHWLRHDSRIPTILRLFENLHEGGVLAFQVPDNYHEPSHRLMRKTALTADAPWSSSFSGTSIGELTDTARPDLDPIETPNEFYDALSPLASSVNIWRTSYQHVLKDARAIVEWVRGTGLQPFLHRIEDEGAKGRFLEEYESRLKGEYRELKDGRVLLQYPRLFIVAVRKGA